MIQRDALLVQSLRDLDTREHADDSIEAAAADHGIAMRAGDDRLVHAPRPFPPADEVPARILRNTQARPGELAAQPRTRLIEQRRKSTAGAPPITGGGSN